VTGPTADWHGRAAPTPDQVEEVRRQSRGRHSSAGILADMQAELRHEYEDNFGLEVVGERDGGRAVFFGEGISAPVGGELDAATLRLGQAGYRVTEWRAVPGGWDGDVEMSRT